MKWVFPFSHRWHDDQDLDGHVEMPYSAAGEGPELDPSKIVRITCWCWRREDCTVIPPKEFDTERAGLLE